MLSARRPRQFCLRRFATAVGVGALASCLWSPKAGAGSISGCDYYAASAGAGDGLSQAAPFQIADFWSVASPGKTLCLLDGIYSGSRSMIAPPAGLSGLSGAPITIKAIYDGTVLITGENTRQPVLLMNNDWFVVEGLDACCSSGTVVGISSNHDTIRRVAAWDAADGNNTIFGIHGGNYNLLEDVAGWGIARKIYESSQGGNFTTIRRAWGRWEGSHVVGPKMVYALAYNNYDMLLENSIGTWSGEKMKQNYVLLDYNGQPWLGVGGGTYTNYDVDQPYGIFATDRLDGDKNARARLLGSIAYVGSADRYKANREVFVSNVDSVEIKDTAAVFAPGGTYSGKYTFGLYGLVSGGQTSVQALNLMSISADSLGDQIGASWQEANIFRSRDTTALKSSGDAYSGIRGANLCRQYVDGNLTDRPLWPWPMNRRITQAMTQSGHAPVDITATITGLFGPLPADCVATDFTIPIASHVRGVGGLEFFTDIHVANPANEAARAELIFQNSTDGKRYEVSLRLKPYETLNFQDVISSVFGLPGNIGALKLETDANGANSLRMTSRTYANGSVGTFGEAVPGVPDRTPPQGQSTFVTGLAVTDGYRSNVGAVNTTEEMQSFKIILWDQSGTVVGVTPVQYLAPGSQLQWSIKTLFPDASGKALLSEFRPEDGSLAPVAYGAVIDNFSSDPTYYPSMRPADLLYLPGVARISGVGGTRFLSDVSLANPNDTPATVTVTFLERDKENTSAPSTTFTISAHQTRQMDDGLLTLFGLSETYGALKIQTALGSGLVASERIYTSSSTPPGTVGQQVDPVTPDGFFSNGSLLGLRQNLGFRTNVGLFNPSSSWAAVNLTLLAADGESLGIASILIPALGYIQRSLPELFGADPFPSESPLTVSVDAGDSKIFAFATIVDNASNDPTYSPGLF